MTITQYLNDNGFSVFEGYSQQVPQQVEDLIQISSQSNLHVMEIGFNAGHSAEIFLQNNPGLTLTSFDLGQHAYVSVAKNYIDATYPNRHTLILGNSTLTVPNFVKENGDAKFDIIFIDGGHDYNIAKADMENCKPLAHQDTIVILDDTIFTHEWQAGYTVGPTQIWSEYIQQNKVVELQRKEYCHGRGMCWGKYVL